MSEPTIQIFQQDAETAVLSIILQDPTRLFELQNLQSFMFSSVPNQIIYSTIVNLSSAGAVPEINLLDNYLKSKNADLRAGGRDYLHYLMNQSYDKTNLKEFEKIIVNSYKARTLIAVSNKVSQDIFSTGDVGAVIEGLRKTLDNLTQSSGGEDTVNFETALRDTWTGIVDRVKNPGIRGITTGLESLDLSTGGISPGELWFIAGRPGMGKTASKLNLMINQAKRGIPTMIFSLEMRKESLTERLISILTEIPSSNIRLGLLNQESLDKISDAIKVVKELPIFIDSNFNSNTEYICSTIRRYKNMYGIKLAYVDYIQLLAERNLQATNELGAISRAFKLLANELGLGMVVGSQLNRLVELRENKRPILSDLRQSGNLEEDADMVLGLYRDTIYNSSAQDKSLMEIILLKNRNGPTGMVPVSFEGDVLTIKDRYDAKQKQAKGK